MVTSVPTHFDGLPGSANSYVIVAVVADFDAGGGFRTLPFAGVWVWYPPKLYGLRPFIGGARV